MIKWVPSEQTVNPGPDLGETPTIETSEKKIFQIPTSKPGTESGSKE